MALHEVSNYLNGIGRITQYQSHDDQRICDPNNLYIQGIYEGQIQNGKAHGFGRMIFGQFHYAYTGYFDQALKHGKGISLTSEGEISKQGIWEHMDTVLEEREIDSFDQISDLEIQKIKKEVEYRCAQNIAKERYWYPVS